MNNNKKPSRTLVKGDRFTLNGEVGVFQTWRGHALSNRYGVYRKAYVLNSDNEFVMWSLNQAGSVEVSNV